MSKPGQDRTGQERTRAVGKVILMSGRDMDLILATLHLHPMVAPLPFLSQNLIFAMEYFANVNGEAEQQKWQQQVGI